MTTILIILCSILCGWMLLYVQDAMKEYEAAIVYKEEKLKYLVVAMSAFVGWLIAVIVLAKY